MKRALQTVWKGILSELFTLTAAIVVLMLCAVVAFSSRQSPSSAPVSPVNEDAVASVAPAVPEPVAAAPVAAPEPTTAYEYVRGYTKKDGTTVKGYYRTKADSTKDNNWSEKGNTNPFTGQAGTKTQ